MTRKIEINLNLEILKIKESFRSRINTNQFSYITQKRALFCFVWVENYIPVEKCPYKQINIDSGYDFP